MKQLLPLFILLSLCVLVFSNKGGHHGGDNGGSGNGGGSEGDASFHACDPSNRQQACTFEYIPVCGYIHNCEGGDCTLTFGNKCAACASDNVDGYVDGACEDIRTDCDPRNRPEACPLNYLPTCAVAANCQGAHCFEDTSNSCMACSMEGVAYSLPGACPQSNQNERTYCDASSRPEICTADYNPVCAHRAGCFGDHCYFTAGNACSACGDASVDWHTPGACPGDEDDNGRTYCDANNRQVACTLDYTPVCAHRIRCKRGHCFYTAGNACSACGDSNVDWHTPGECPRGDDDNERTYCDGNNRPEVCTLDYTPVCAHRARCKGRRCYFTAGNACSACADDRVNWHTPGEC